MTTGRQLYLVQPYAADGRGSLTPSIGGLQTDDVEQAMRRARRLWDGRSCAGVAVVRTWWPTSGGTTASEIVAFYGSIPMRLPTAA